MSSVAGLCAYRLLHEEFYLDLVRIWRVGGQQSGFRTEGSLHALRAIGFCHLGFVNMIMSLLSAVLSIGTPLI